MAGLADYLAEQVVNFATGTVPFAAVASRYLALFTTAPTSDAGTGGTEVSAGTYARVQVAGALTAASTITGGTSTTITLAATAPAWLLALGTNGSGCNVYDVTAGKQIGTVSTISGTTVTLTTTASNSGSGSSDSLIFSAFPQSSASSGTEPSVTPVTVTNGASISFATSGASAFGTCVAFAIYDALTSGNMQAWDYLGAYKWIPFSGSNASPCVLTCDTAADAPANSSSVVVTSKFGGTLPTTGGSWAGILATANLSGATFTAGVNSTGIGGGMFRQVTQQSVPTNTIASFAAGQLTITSA